MGYLQQITGQILKETAMLVPYVEFKLLQEKDHSWKDTKKFPSRTYKSN